MLPPQTGLGPRERLVAIAMELLDHHHPEDLSLREVARRAGLTSGAPSHHFGNKLGLLAACAEVSWSEMCARMASANPGDSVEEGLRNMAHAYVDYALDHPGPYRLMTSRMFKQGTSQEAIATWRKRAMAGVVTLIEQASTAKEPMYGKRRGLAVWALLHGHVSLVLDGAISEQYVAAITEDVCRMAPTLALFGAP